MTPTVIVVRNSMLFVVDVVALASLLSPLAPMNKPIEVGLTKVTLPIEAGLTRVIWLAKCLTQNRIPLRLGSDVEVRPNDKGQGLYALRPLECGECVGLYWGQLLTEEDYQKSDSDGTYAMGLANGKVIDGADPRTSNFLRYINHSKLRANCAANDEALPIEALAAVSINVAKDIPEGAELLFDYGDAYWDDRYPKWSPTRWMIDLL